MKVADVKLSWKKSVSADIDRVEILVTVNGTETKTDLTSEVEEFMIEVAASGSAQFQIITFDKEGSQSSSVIYSFTLGDLEPPQPATDLTHQVVAVRDAA